MKSSPLPLCILGMVVISSLAAARSRAADFPEVRFPAGRTSVVVPLRVGGERYLAPVQINGKDIGWFLIDTGCALTVINSKVVAALDLPYVTSTEADGIAGSEKMPLYAPRSLTVGGVTIEPIVVAEAPGSIGLAGDIFINPHISGVLGMNVLRHIPFTLNFPAATLTLHDPASFRPPAGARRFPLRMLSNLPFVRVDFGGDASAWLTLDTGGEGDLIFDSALVKSQPELVEGRPWQHTFFAGLGQHMVQGRITVLDRVQCLGQEARSVGVKYRTDEEESMPVNALGAHLMRGLTVTLACRSGEFFVEKAASPHPTAWDQTGFNPSEPDAIGYSPLMQAIVMREPKYIKRFLAAKVDVNAHSVDNMTALYFAAKNGDLATVRLLLAAGAGIGPVAAGEMTPLMGAARQPDPAVVSALLDAGAKVDEQNRYGFTALIYAAEYGHTDIVKALLRAKADVALESPVLGTALHAAAAHGYTEIVKLLIGHGADVNALTQTDRVSPLACAAESGSVETVRLLLDHGARVDDRNAAGETALIVAASDGHMGVVNLLLKEGADANVLDHDGNTAVKFAGMNNHLEVMARLYFSTHPPATQPR